jgi:hypothetical protein
MDFRPLGDGMSCVAVAMPHAGLEEGTTDAAPGLRRIYAAARKHAGERGGGLAMGCLSIQTTMLARLSGGSRIRRNARRERVGGRRASERLRLRERRTGRGLSEQASCRERGSRCGV